MPPEAVLALGAVIALGGYLAACRWWPFASCFRCHGTGRRNSTGTPFYALGAVIALAGLLAGWGGLTLTGAMAAGVGLLVRGRSYRSCPRCNGTGRRRRLGRALVRNR